MDSYKKLLDNHQYDLIILLSKNDDTSEGLWARLLALIGVGRDDEALDLIAKNENKLMDHLSEMIDLHLEILKQQDKIDEILSALDHYDALPYQSFEVEEKIHHWKKVVLTTQKKTKKRQEDLQEEIKGRLRKAEKADRRLFALFENLKNMRISLFSEEISSYLASEADDAMKTYLLLLLVDNKVMQEFTLLKRGITYKVVPYELDPPFVSNAHMMLIELIERMSPNPSTTNIAIELYNSYVLEIYPETIDEDEYPLLGVTFILLAHHYLREEVPYEEYAEKAEIDVHLLKGKFAELLEILQNIKPLTF